MTLARLFAPEASGVSLSLSLSLSLSASLFLKSLFKRPVLARYAQSARARYVALILSYRVLRASCCVFHGLITGALEID